MDPIAGSTIIPSLRYRDAPAAIDWLCRAFGFQKHAVYADGDIVHHAQLTYGPGMIMLGSVVEDEGNEWARRIVQPDEIGGRETQACSVIVADADEHYARARAAGAQIVADIADQDFGGRAYTCRDLEGRLWWFGTYNPWTL